MSVRQLAMAGAIVAGVLLALLGCRAWVMRDIGLVVRVEPGRMQDSLASESAAVASP